MIWIEFNFKIVNSKNLETLLTVDLSLDESTGHCSLEDLDSLGKVRLEL